MIWCAFSISPEVGGNRHRETGCDMRMFRSSLLHRALWLLFYGQTYSWRLHRFYQAYEFLASYLSLFSYEFLRKFCLTRPDLLFLQDYATGRFDVLLILAKLRNRPLVAYHSGSAPENYVGRFFKRWTLPRADCLIASSAVEKTLLVERF